MWISAYIVFDSLITTLKTIEKDNTDNDKNKINNEINHDVNTFLIQINFTPRIANLVNFYSTETKVRLERKKPLNEGSG